MEILNAVENGNHGLEGCIGGTCDIPLQAVSPYKCPGNMPAVRRGGRESSFHALVTCMNTSNLRELMRDEWPLPKREEIVNTGEEWLLHLSAGKPKEMCDMIIILI